MLLQEAYQAAEELKQACEHGALVEAVDDDGDGQATEEAREKLRRIFNVGAVAALIGFKYSASKDMGLYGTGEALRGLVELEANERDRCANFAQKAVSAGLAERLVRQKEQIGDLVFDWLEAVLKTMALSPDQEQAAKITALEKLAILDGTAS